MTLATSVFLGLLDVNELMFVIITDGNLAFTPSFTGGPMGGALYFALVGFTGALAFVINIGEEVARDFFIEEVDFNGAQPPFFITKGALDFFISVVCFVLKAMALALSFTSRVD